eukprot:s4180_g5.t1
MNFAAGNATAVVKSEPFNLLADAEIGDGAGCSNREHSYDLSMFFFFCDDVWLRRCCLHSNPACKLS